GDRRRGQDLDRRMRLIDVHVASSAGSREPIELRVDARRWWSPQLFGVQRHRLAVAPGVHELEIVGPPGTVAWVGAPPDTREATVDRLGRRERMWPLARSLWRLPGPAVPGFVRLELRWLDGVPSEPVRIRVIEDGTDAARVVLLDPGTIELDADALPIDGSARASVRHDVVLPLAAATTELRFEIQGDEQLPIAAALSLRRGPQTTDFALLGAGREPEDQQPELRLDDLAGLDHAALLTELAALSRRLLERPDDLEARAGRAGILLLRGETGHTRADLLWLAAFAEREDLAASRRERANQLLAELEQRFEALTDPREIVVADRERVATPELIEPAIAAIVGEHRAAIEPWLDRWAELRDADLEQALARLDADIDSLRSRHADPIQLLLASATRAHLLDRDRARARE